jgi:hypothetical protein
MKAFDATRFDKEAAKLGINLFGRRALAHLKADVLERKKTWNEKLDALVKKDGDWKKLMDAADAGFKKWVADYQTFKPGLEDAKKFLHIIESDDPRTAKGCSNTMRKHLGEYMKSRKAKTLEGAVAAMTDPVGLHMTLALASCDSVDKLPVETTAIFYKPYGDGLSVIKMDTVRGPRYAQYTATLAALAEILSERPKFPVRKIEPGWDKFHDLVERIKNDAIGGKLGEIRGGSGLIQSLTPSKGGVKVSFKSYKVKVDDVSCKATTKISRIYQDGTVEYWQDCNVTGAHSETRKTEAIVVPKEQAAGLKVGYTLHFMAFTDGSDRAGVPLAAYKDEKMKEMRSYLGIEM